MVRCGESGLARVLSGGPGGYGGDNSPASQARLNRPHGICHAPDGSVFIGDTLNHRVRKVFHATD